MLSFRSALSEGEYTQSSLEHQFRDVRKAAQELLRGKPSVDGEQAKPASPKKRKCTCAFTSGSILMVGSGKSKTDKNVEDNAENSQPPSKRARPSKKEVDIKVEPMEGDNAV